MRPGGKGVQESESEIGYVVGDNTSEMFRFVIAEDAQVRKWGYVYGKGLKIYCILTRKSVCRFY